MIYSSHEKPALAFDFSGSVPRGNEYGRMPASAMSVAVSTIFAVLVGAAIAASPAFAVLLVVIGAVIPAATAVWLAGRQERIVTSDAQAVLDDAARKAVVIIEAATEKAQKLVEEARETK